MRQISSTLFAMRADERQCAPATDTGCGDDIELALARVCIPPTSVDGSVYGTRTSTVVLITWDGWSTVFERERGSDGAWGEVVKSELPPWTVGNPYEHYNDVPVSAIHELEFCPEGAYAKEYQTDPFGDDAGTRRECEREWDGMEVEGVDVMKRGVGAHVLREGVDPVVDEEWDARGVRVVVR